MERWKPGNSYFVRQFEADDLKKLNGNIETLGGIDWNKLIQSYKQGPAYTAFYQNKIIAIGGIMLLWPGMGEAWAYLAPEAQKHKFFIHRQALTCLAETARSKNLQRIQGCAVKVHEKAKRWLEALGFEYEGIMKKYWNGQDFVRYGRVF